MKPANNKFLIILGILSVLVLVVTGYANLYGWFGAGSASPQTDSLTVSAPITSSDSKPAVAYIYDLNCVTEEQLQLIPELGPVLSRRIVAYREQNGPYQTTEDLLNVKGIGPKTYQKIKAYFKVSQNHEE